MDYYKLRSLFYKAKKQLDNSKVMLSLIFSGIFIFSFLLYLESFHRSLGGKNEVVGFTSLLSNSVKRKNSGSVIWDTVTYEMPLLRYDTVRTDTESNSIIKLIDDTEIRLDENSMVMLDIKDKNQKIELFKGSYQVSKKSLDSVLEVYSGELRVDVKKVGNYNFKVHKNGKVDISVNTGEAIVHAKSIIYDIKEAFLGFFSGGKKETSKKGNAGGKDEQNNSQESNQNTNQFTQSNELDKTNQLNDSPWVVESYSVLKFPENLKFFLSSEKAHPIEFSWVSKEDVSKLQISLKDDFSSIYKEAITKDKNMKLSLPIGSYYWRVIPANPKAKFATEVRKFIILKDTDFHLRFPDKDAVFYIRDKSVLVNFAWDNLEDISKYTLLISKTPEFEKIEHSIDAQSNILSVDFSKTGTYYYKVRAIQKNPDFPEKITGVGSFNVILEEDSNRLELLNPPNNQKVDGTSKILFGWEDNKAFNSFNLVISENEAFSLNVKKINTKNNYSVNENLEKDKEYYWKVEGVKQDGKIVSSEVRAMSTKINFVPKKEEPKVVTPKPEEPKKVEQAPPPKKEEPKTVSQPAKTSPKLNAPKSKVNTEIKYDED
ncbi:MAG: FecR domain-containing protein [Leptospiraceae bacterium]|nr:FecR domain-containing protein [Leptospiraceae bacterium]